MLRFHRSWSIKTSKFGFEIKIIGEALVWKFIHKSWNGIIIENFVCLKLPVTWYILHTLQCMLAGTICWEWCSPHPSYKHMIRWLTKKGIAVITCYWRHCQNNTVTLPQVLQWVLCEVDSLKDIYSMYTEKFACTETIQPHNKSLNSSSYLFISLTFWVL